MNREATIKGQKITCLGELLIDFVCTDIAQGLVKGENFLKKAGGAPANVAVAIARLGGNARLAAQVGNDPFGEFLIQTLRRESLDTSLIIRDNHAPTTLAFVGIQHDGERDFVFCRGADGNLSQESLPVDFLKDSGIVHLGAATGLLDGQLYQTSIRPWHNTQKKKVKCSPLTPISVAVCGADMSLSLFAGVNRS